MLRAQLFGTLFTNHSSFYWLILTVGLLKKKKPNQETFAEAGHQQIDVLDHQPTGAFLLIGMHFSCALSEGSLVSQNPA